MSIEKRIGIVGGNGWLGRAITKAALASGTLDPSRLTLSVRGALSGVDAPPGVRVTDDNAELAAHCDVILLSVRPDQFEAVRIDASGKLVVSVMAAVSTAAITERTGASEVVRALPNAAAAIGRSFTPWFAAPSVSDAHRALVQTLFESCGEAAEVPEEAHVDYCVGLTGSGAAFPALLAEALTAHAITAGLPRDFAERAARSVLADASQLLALPGASAKAIVQEMTDYRGTTAAALLAMREAGFDRAVASGLAAAAAKAAAMAKA